MMLSLQVHRSGVYTYTPAVYQIKIALDLQPHLHYAITCVRKTRFQGLDLYFERHDGSAVTCDDFLAAMADANGEDLSLMSR